MIDNRTTLDPRASVLEHVLLPETRGIEIGPYRRPIAPKAKGHNTLIVDCFSRNELVEKAGKTCNNQIGTETIEEVDVVGDASRLLDLLRREGIDAGFDWIVSSHNFEHLPNPIRFLRDCQALLAPHGVLAMVIPDKRFCMDRFQPVATFAGVVEAWERDDDDLWCAFRQQACKVQLDSDGGNASILWTPSCDDPERLRSLDPRPAFARLREGLVSKASTVFRGHRWRFTPASFESLMYDLWVVGLVGLELELVSKLPSGEFIALLKMMGSELPNVGEVEAHRSLLHRRAEDEAAVVSHAYRRLEAQLAALQKEISMNN